MDGCRERWVGGWRSRGRTAAKAGPGALLGLCYSVDEDGLLVNDDAQDDQEDDADDGEHAAAWCAYREEEERWVGGFGVDGTRRRLDARRERIGVGWWRGHLQHSVVQGSPMLLVCVLCCLLCYSPPLGKAGWAGVWLVCSHTLALSNATRSKHERQLSSSWPLLREKHQATSSPVMEMGVEGWVDGVRAWVGGWDGPGGGH